VIQNSQNRDAKAVHIKLDELIEAMEGARNRIALAETETEEQQDRDIEEMAKRAHDEAIERRAESRLER
jgi:low affinity Fe/Cu permease